MPEEGSSPPISVRASLSETSVHSRTSFHHDMPLASPAAKASYSTFAFTASESVGAMYRMGRAMSTLEVLTNWEWIPHPYHGFIPAYRTRENDVGNQEAYMTMDDEEIFVDGPQSRRGLTPRKEIENTITDGAFSDVHPIQLRRLRTDDLLDLHQTDTKGKQTEMHAASVLHQLRIRYEKEQIYTDVGRGILLSVNPFRLLPLYSAQNLQKYVDVDNTNDLETLPAHVFKMAARALLALRQNNKDQAIVITGESGSGKTEAAKLLIHFIVQASSAKAKAGEIAEAMKLQRRILFASPLLESFGNAKTARNNNSSRHGKWMSLQFASRKSADSEDITLSPVCGGQIVTLLLEKTRVVSPGPEERNYHIFYQLCSVAQAANNTQSGETDEVLTFLNELGIGQTEKFNYLKTRHYSLPGVNEHEALLATIRRLRYMGVTNKEIKDIFSVLASVLHLGNLEPSEGEGGVYTFEPERVECVTKHLQLDPKLFTETLTSRKVQLRNESNTIPFNKARVISSRDVMAKHLYGRLFSWLVERVNEHINPVRAQSKKLHVINIFDIFGMESFAINGLDQLFINYTNERLQQHFLNFCFNLEEQVYKDEGIPWDKRSNFLNNQPCIELFEGTPRKRISIFTTLDEESKMDHSDDSFLERLMTLQDHPHICVKNQPARRFTIHHYAGDVEYCVDGFVKLNSDKLDLVLYELLGSAGLEFVELLFPPHTVSSSSVFSRLLKADKKKKSQKRTVAQQIRTDVDTFLGVLGNNEPHFVRCLQPNPSKEPDNFKGAYLLRQLKCAGIVEALHIRSNGYSVRIPHPEFCETFANIFPSLKLVGNTTPKECRKSAEALVNMCIRAHKLAVNHFKDTEVSPQQIRVGKTKVFMTPDVHFMLYVVKHSKMARVHELTQSVSRGSTYAAVTRFVEEDEKLDDSELRTIGEAGPDENEESKDKQSTFDYFKNGAPYESTSFHRHRPAKEFLKGVLFNRQNLKDTHLTHQTRPLPNSLVQYSATLRLVTGETSFSLKHKNRVRGVQKQALLMFTNMLYYACDQWHQYPATCGHAIISTGMNEPVLRDEIYLQLIKQSTKNPNEGNRILVWKLILMCVLSFEPFHHHIRFVLLDHCARVAGVLKSFDISTLHSAIFHDVGHLASVCFTLYLDLYGCPSEPSRQGTSGSGSLKIKHLVAASPDTDGFELEGINSATQTTFLYSASSSGIVFDIDDVTELTNTSRISPQISTKMIQTLCLLPYYQDVKGGAPEQQDAQEDIYDFFGVPPPSTSPPASL